MLHTVVTAALQDVAKTHQIGLDVGGGIFQGVTHPRLGGEVHHGPGLDGSKQLSGRLTIGEIVEPVTPEDWVTVHVKAASLNHHDLWSLKGQALSAERVPMITVPTLATEEVARRVAGAVLKKHPPVIDCAMVSADDIRNNVAEINAFLDS